MHGVDWSVTSQAFTNVIDDVRVLIYFEDLHDDCGINSKAKNKAEKTVAEVVEND